jgi:hypothetical protein
MQKLTKKELTQEIPRLEVKYVYDIECKRISGDDTFTRVVVADNEIVAARVIYEQLSYNVDYIVSIIRRPGSVRA